MADDGDDLFDESGFFDPRDSRDQEWTACSEKGSYIISKDYANNGAP